LWIHDNDLIVGTHGRSFWVLDDISPLRQVNAAMAEQSAALLRPAAAYRVRYNTNTDTPLPPDEPFAENPPDGAVIDYYLRQAAAGPVTLEILDAKGKPVRRYASNDAPEVSEADMKALSIPVWWVRPPRVLPASAGMHRWVWDLRYATPDSLRREYPISAIPHNTPRSPQGPRVLPGTYTVKLTADGKTYSAALTLKMDPRVKTPASALQQMFDAQVKLARIMTETSRAVRQARSAQQQIEKLSRDGGAVTLEAIGKRIKAELEGGGFSGPAPAAATLMSLNGQASALYGDVDSADAAPSAALAAAVEKVAGEYPAVKARWTGLLAELKAARPEIQIDTKPTADEESDDSDLE